MRELGVTKSTFKGFIGPKLQLKSLAFFHRAFKHFQILSRIIHTTQNVVPKSKIFEFQAEKARAGILFFSKTN